jgi:hypothetical protein
MKEIKEEMNVQTQKLQEEMMRRDERQQQFN